MSSRKHHGKAVALKDTKVNWKYAGEAPPPQRELPAAEDKDDTVRAAANVQAAARKPKPTVKRRTPRVPTDRRIAVKGASERVAARSRKQAFR